MRLETAYPTGTCTGTDFVYGGFLGEGERAVNLERDSYDLPVVGGLLCLSETTIAKIVRLLDWPSPEQFDELASRMVTAEADAELLRARLAELEADRDEAIAALRAINRHTATLSNTTKAKATA